MPRGGHRPGSGRPPGTRNRKTLAKIEAAAAAVAENAAATDLAEDLPADPLSVGLRALAALEAAGEWAKAGALAVKLARFTAQPMRPTERTPPPHPAQNLPLLDLAPVDAPASAGDVADSPALAIARRMLDRRH